MAPSTILLVTSMSIAFYITLSEIIHCNGDCTCTQDQGQATEEPCTLNCATPDSCRSSTLTCATGRPCTIMCTDSSSCADYAYINAMTATDVYIACNGNDACKSQLTVLCGTGDCHLQCGPTSECEQFGSVDFSRSNSFTCTNCPKTVENLQFTPDPTKSPTKNPSFSPTKNPTISPTTQTNNPTISPTNDPTNDPTSIPTSIPTISPTSDPTHDPTNDPTSDPTNDPTSDPTSDPTNDPTKDPTNDPTKVPSSAPTNHPTNNPSMQPSKYPSVTPTQSPSFGPTKSTIDPTMQPTNNPVIITSQPTIIETIDVNINVLYAQKDADKKKSEDLLVVVICLVLFIVVLVVFGGVWWRRKKKFISMGMVKQHQNHGLIEIVQEGKSHVNKVGTGKGLGQGYLVRVHHNGKQFDFKLNGSESGETDDCGWSENTYDALMSEIKKKFKIDDNFGLHEVVDDCPIDIEDMDDIVASFDCCVYDKNRRSIDLFVKTEDDLHFGFINNNDTNAMLDGEELESDSDNDVITRGR